MGIQLVVPRIECQELRRARTNNATDTAFPARPITLTPPQPLAYGGNDGVLRWDLKDNVPVANYLKIIPFGRGVGSFQIQLLGWDTDGTTWVPTTLAILTCTLGGVPGVAGSTLITDADFLCSSVSVDVGNAPTASTLILSSTIDDLDAELNMGVWAMSNGNAYAVVGLQGTRIQEMQFACSGVTGANAIVKGL